MINGKMKMYDIVLNHPLILLVLDHFTIRLGFGDQTIKDVCKRHDINEHLFLTIANLFCCRDEVVINAQNFYENDALQILKFLKTSHKYFLEEKIPNLKTLIGQKTVKSHQDKYSRLIEKFIHDYAAEVMNHMNYENTVVFPYVETLLRKQTQFTNYSIDQFQKQHSNIEDKLIDLRNLLVKHVPPEYDSVIRRQMLFELYSLEYDINIHDFIENNILIPIVKRLEMEQK